MRKTIASFVLAASLAALPSVARATDPGEELAFSTLAALSNIFYTPAKVVVAAVGLTVGAVAGFLNGGDTRSAYAFWVPTASTKFFGMDWIIFSKEDIDALMATAAKFDLHPVGPLNYAAGDRVIDCAGKHYTFGMLVLRKGA